MSKPEIADMPARTWIDELEVRGLDEEKRTATFVAATEGGVLTWGGREILRMNGVNLKRYRRNPVILDAHDRGSTGAVIGKGKVTVRDRELLVEITFASTARAEEIWTLVKGGFVNALSVGFMPDASRTVRLAEGESDGEGENEVKGPATVIKGWELYEISVVPVPADPDALKRGAAEWMDRFGIETKERTMSEEKKPEEQKDQQPAGQQTPPPAPEKRDAAEPQKPDFAARVRAVAPQGMDSGEVDQIVLQHAEKEDFGGACRAMLEKLTVQSAPAGTPEPKQPEKKDQEENGKARSFSEMEERDIAAGFASASL